VPNGWIRALALAGVARERMERVVLMDEGAAEHAVSSTTHERTAAVPAEIL
jgi:hypothetical protein